MSVRVSKLCVCVCENMFVGACGGFRGVAVHQLSGGKILTAAVHAAKKT